ncbi:uncharacterized protein Z520_00897 [Fonsecaea multimorphosa CBS 102226]|uniref:GST N-terminal domain-containing protein n=1 Tax=Fonsecaea multimorphosa CBS 102226 TaxID=1442371 RepID=A0A0D2L540_9EURO|nr:uncharacterized protein Z520_00897 [Fonsecaea multimorphosa CBS 102226]KIY04204.1 hypothetical protein Z520_00897 [Fonsecaea multimorphosa CBS 102226]
MAQDGSSDPKSYVLYYNPFSICSLMVLHTIETRGSAKDSASEMAIVPEVIDIFHEGQLSEHYLCDINPEGQVPVLYSPALLKKPIADSLEITEYMAERYPSLIPKEHEQLIRRLLVDLHALNFFSLSFPGRPTVAAGMKAAVVRRLQMPGISERYREALKFKLTVLDRDKIGGIVPEVVQDMVTRAKNFLAEVESMVPDAPCIWLFGDAPTAFDAHLVVFLARMKDVKRDNLFPPKVARFAERAFETPAWKAVIQDRKTMVGEY